MSNKDLVRAHLTDRDAWRKARLSGIGASEAAAVVGLSPWLTASELWEIKTGKKKAPSLSGNIAVATGVEKEPILRSFYKSLHPQYKVSYHQFDLLSQKGRPWLFATLDGELKDGNRKGILEIKTSTPVGTKGWGDWNEQIPIHYRTQLCHQLLATGYDFAVLYACLFSREQDMTIREYHFERADLEEDMAWLLEKEVEFWGKVERREVPALSLML